MYSGLYFDRGFASESPLCRPLQGPDPGWGAVSEQKSQSPQITHLSDLL